MVVYIDGQGTSYEGRVLCTREQNGYDDSDFYAVVWDDATNSVKSVEYATTRGWTYNNYAKVDATPEVIQKAREWTKKTFVKLLEARYLTTAKFVEKGKTVRVISGRKVPVGTEGVVFGIYPNNYSKYNDKVGILVDGEKIYTYINNVEVVNPEQYLPAKEHIEKLAEANKNEFHLPFARGIVL